MFQKKLQSAQVSKCANHVHQNPKNAQRCPQVIVRTLDCKNRSSDFDSVIISLVNGRVQLKGTRLVEEPIEG